MNTIKKQVLISDIDIGTEVKSEKGNKYPNLYVTLKLLTDIIDPSEQRYYPRGCTALVNGTQNIKGDFEHNGYFAEKKGGIEAGKRVSNAGEMVSLEVVEEEDHDSLYGKVRVGVEHNLMMDNGEVVGSAYASLWQLQAQRQVVKNGGSIFDYIPEHIKTEFFDGQTVYPIKSLSVEVISKHYKSENYTDLNGIMHIHKYDMPRFAWLALSSEGQPMSQIKDIEIKKIQLADKPPNNQKTMNKKTKVVEIKCLCEAGIGEMVIKNSDVFEVIKSDNLNHKYSIKNVLTDETIEVETEAEAVTPEIKSVIKACQSCLANKRKMQEMMDKKESEKTPTVKSDYVDNSLLNNPMDMSKDMDMMSKLEAILNKMSNILTRLEDLEPVKSTPEVKTDEVETAQEIETGTPATEQSSIEGAESTPKETEEVDEIKSMQSKIQTISFDFSKPDESDGLTFRRIK
jgi:hypothetical protein